SKTLKMSNDPKWNKNVEDLRGKNEANLPSDAWMVRPCEAFKDEYSECKSWKGRFHQTYVYGNHFDCSRWKEDFENCMKFRKYDDLDALDKVLKHEKERRKNRLRAAHNNDVWEYRSEPYKEWNSPLSEANAQQAEQTLFAIKEKEKLYKQNKEQSGGSMCVIS
ncbi:unnamed protein product, partial [Owenia fusiformis]